MSEGGAGGGIATLQAFSECSPGRVQTAALFKSRFSAAAQPEQPRLPVLITGLTSSWAAQERWQLAALKEERGACVVNVGDDPSAKSGEKTLPLREMIARMGAEPALYVFEAKLEERLPEIGGEYGEGLEQFFDDDVLRLFPEAAAAAAVAEETQEEEVEEAEEEKEQQQQQEEQEEEEEEEFGKPDSRWFLLGAAGSGTEVRALLLLVLLQLLVLDPPVMPAADPLLSQVHQDPPHMSSWNACVVSKKLLKDLCCAFLKSSVSI